MTVKQLLNRIRELYDELVECLRALQALDPAAAEDVLPELGSILREDVTFRANVKMEVHGPDGALKQSVAIHNLICTAGKNFLLDADLADAKTVRLFGYIAIGTGTNAAAVGDTALQTEVARAAATLSNPSAGTLRMVATFAAGIGTGGITESGLLDAASSGNLLARQVFAVVNKGAGDSLTVTWDIT